MVRGRLLFVVFEAKNKFVIAGIAKFLTNNMLDQGGIMAELIEIFFLLLQPSIGFG